MNLDQKMINLDQIMVIENPDKYKMHIAKYNGNCNPLDDFIEDPEIWFDWNKWRGEGNKNRFNRQFVISFFDFYPQRGTFLFGGIFEIIKTYSDHYDIKLCQEYCDFIGRLKVTNINTSRGSSFKFEKYYKDIQVVELFDQSYSSHVFPGYGRIDYPFKQIEGIIKREQQDWKSALLNVKGIYMLTDTKTGKRYIGSAYGDFGIWSRWKQYCENGHGNDKDLRKIVEKKGFEYLEQNFKFTLLEIHSMFERDSDIILRENYWKKVMMSRNKTFGYNNN